MPWEIIRTEVPVVSISTPPGAPLNSSTTTTRILDLYTKNGGTGTYNTQFGLSPDHGFGFVVLTAGPASSGASDEKFAAMQMLNEMITAAFVPAFEDAALEQAISNFAGTYATVGNSTTLPMKMTIAAGDGGLGLSVQNWTMGDLDIKKSYMAALSVADLSDVTGEPDLRLYPVGLKDERQMAFRGVFDYQGSSGVYSTAETTPFGRRCVAWATVGSPHYGNVGLDDFVFDIDGSGCATAITTRGARKTLARQT